MFSDQSYSANSKSIPGSASMAARTCSSAYGAMKAGIDSARGSQPASVKSEPYQSK